MRNKIQNTIANKIAQNKWHNSYGLVYKYKNINFDSRWEVEFAKFLDKKDLKWIRNTTMYFEYIWKNKKHKYYPDFYLPDFDIFVEIKGLPTERDYAKWDQCSSKLDIYDGLDLYKLGIIKEYEFNKNSIVKESYKYKNITLLKSTM